MIDLPRGSRRPRADTLALALALATAAACGGDTQASPPVGSGTGATTPAAPPGPTPAPAPALPAVVAGQYQLATSTAGTPLPARPAAFVFVTTSGAIRVGSGPAFAEAEELAGVGVLRGRLPPPAAAATADAAAGPDADAAERARARQRLDPGVAVNPNLLGQGPGSGVFAELASDADADAGAGLGTIGASRHGTSAAGAHHVVVARLDRTAPASARIVVVADHGVTIGTLDRVLRGIDEPVALAVAGAGDAAAALPFTIVPGTAGAASGARELRLTLERPGAVTLAVDGQVYFVEPRPDATTDRAELDRGVAHVAGAAPLSAFRLEARPERLLGPAVAALDAMARGAAPGTIYLRVDRGGGGMRSGRIALPLTRFGNVTAEGELDRAIIRRYLRRAAPKLTYCYEQRLLTQPSLAGTVTTDLVIDGQGRVTSARSKGVDPSVERCVAAVVKAIVFPRPHAGIVRVSFPIEFQPTGG